MNSINNYYDKIKQSFKIVVNINMNNLLNNVSEHIKEIKTEESLFVKNLIINKEKPMNVNSIYVPTEKWVMQLGKRLEFNG